MKQNLTRFISMLLAPTAFVLLTGFMISPLKVKSEAFGGNKTYAIVSIIGSSKITTDNQSGGLAGLIKGASKKYSFSKDSGKILEETIPVLVEEFQRSKSFQLAPKNFVFENQAYLTMAPDKPKKFMGVSMVPAEGYKYFKNKKKIKRLAQEMGADGIIIVSVSYNVGFRGANFSGVAGVGKQKGMATIGVYAVDKNGEVVWKHATQGVSKQGMLSSGGAADFDRLHSALLEASREASQKLIKKLDKKVGT